MGMAWWRRSWAIFSLLLLVMGGIASFSLPKSVLLAAFGDLSALALLVLATVVCLVNAVRSRGHIRAFWGLFTVGCLLWTLSQMGWAVYEVWLRREMPDPYFGDIVLFIHVIPPMTAVALRPHRAQAEQKVHFTSLNFIMLLIWWLFLYAFIVFPDEYVVLNPGVYNHRYDILYLVENLALLVSLGALAARTQGAWRKIYGNLLAAMGLYTLASETMNVAITGNQYYSGCIYDLLFTASVCWLIWTGLLALELNPPCDPEPAPTGRWLMLPPRLAMLAMLSLPVIAFWELFCDSTSPRLREFRLLAAFATMLVLGACVFVRQYLMDRELVQLLQESHASVETLQRLQSQLVQKEKLASLGQLVAGAAHEINNPLAAILGYSELLAATSTLTPDQVTMAQKIAQQARRTRDLVSGLLSFAQQAPAEKKLIDLSSLAVRALQNRMAQLETRNIRAETRLTGDLPKIWGNTNQLFQCCLQIINNASDAMEEVGSGTLTVVTYRDKQDVVMEFLDSGPGIREPRRVFDPFYTTKPVGKGTGLGLSATYGVVQDHGGQITCFNREQGGAAFVLRFPCAGEMGRLEAAAAKASL